MHKYTAYSLGICSALPLPELQPADLEVDVVIQIGKLDASPLNTDTASDFQITFQEAYLFWKEVGTFLVRDGKEIIVDPLPGVEEQIVRLPLLGAVLAVLLHQRGFLVLHASAVAINGGVVAFIGEKGWGKSTMAATLYARGHELMADDVVALDFGSTNPRVFPGFPQLKLWPEAASTLGDDPRTLPQIHSRVEKRARRATDRFAQEALPLRRIYVLAGGPNPAIKVLQPQDAILQLISNSYMARFGKQLLQGVGACLHLRQCTSLIKDVPIYRLERPHSLPLLPTIAQIVEEDLASNIPLVMV